MIVSKIVSQKPVFKARLFEVTQNIIRLPGGKENIYDDVYVCPSVFVFPITEKNEIYLIHEHRYLLKKTVLSAVAGFIEKGETSIQAAKRELKEEVGLVAAQWEELLRLETENSVIKSKKHLFLAKELELTEKALEEDENIELVKISIHDAVEKVLSGEVSGAGTIVGILLLDKLRKEKKL